jgi:hypothetical protein
LGKGGLEQADVLFFCLADLCEVFDLLAVEAEGGKVGFGEFGKAFAVEGFF